MGSTLNNNNEDSDALEKDLQKNAARVMNHMNKDHSDSVRAYAMAFGKDPRCFKETEHATIVALDCEGFLLDVTLTDGTTISKVRVPYQGKVTAAKDLHKEAVSMHRLSYGKLGVWFKIRSGYYQQVTKMIAF